MENALTEKLTIDKELLTAGRESRNILRKKSAALTEFKHRTAPPVSEGRQSH